VLSTVTSRLARTIYVQGRYDEAERFTKVSEQLAGGGDIASQIEWRLIRAMVLARRRDFESAEPLAREAVRLATATDDIVNRGTAMRDLAEVLDLAGKPDEAISLIHGARDLFEQKGNVVAARAADDALRRVRA
jgi:ATP/maltotriose-dependent transcriptional regulator MalT